MQIDKDKIVRAFEENPIGFAAATGMALAGIAKIISAVGEARGSNAYARDVNRRIRQDRRRRQL